MYINNDKPAQNDDFISWGKMLATIYLTTNHYSSSNFNASRHSSELTNTEKTFPEINWEIQNSPSKTRNIFE